MEKKSKHTKKLISLFWAIVGGIPLIVIMILLVNGTFRQNFTLNYETFSNLLNSYNQSDFATTTSSLFNNYLPNLINIFTSAEETSTEVIAISSIINWYVIIQFIHLVIDLLLFIPNVIKNAMNKIGIKDVE